MRIIKQISTEIADNIDEAREKIRVAYELKTESPEAAAWYREMAAAHLNFNQSGHNVVKRLIDAHKESDDYKRNPAYADGMLTAWECIHNSMASKAAEVKAMVDGWK